MPLYTTKIAPPLGYLADTYPQNAEQPERKKPKKKSTLARFGQALAQSYGITPNAYDGVSSVHRGLLTLILTFDAAASKIFPNTDDRDRFVDDLMHKAKDIAVGNANTRWHLPIIRRAVCKSPSMPKFPYNADTKNFDRIEMANYLDAIVKTTLDGEVTATLLHGTTVTQDSIDLFKSYLQHASDILRTTELTTAHEISLAARQSMNTTTPIIPQPSPTV